MTQLFLIDDTEMNFTETSFEIEAVFSGLGTGAFLVMRATMHKSLRDGEQT